MQCKNLFLQFIYQLLFITFLDFLGKYNSVLSHKRYVDTLQVCISCHCTGKNPVEKGGNFVSRRGRGLRSCSNRIMQIQVFVFQQFCYLILFVLKCKILLSIDKRTVLQQMLRKSSKRKETEVDFEEKKMNLSIGQDDLDKENDYYTRTASPVQADESERWR